MCVSARGFRFDSACSHLFDAIAVVRYANVKVFNRFSFNKIVIIDLRKNVDVSRNHSVGAILTIDLNDNDVFDIDGFRIERCCLKQSNASNPNIEACQYVSVRAVLCVCHLQSSTLFIWIRNIFVRPLRLFVRLRLLGWGAVSWVSHGFVICAFALACLLFSLAVALRASVPAVHA